MGEVSGEQDVARFSNQPVSNPVRRIIGLNIAGRRELSQRIAGAPERLGRLLGAKLTAVPDHSRFGAARRRFSCETLDRGASVLRERALRIHVGTDGFSMVNEKESQVYGRQYSGAKYARDTQTVLGFQL